MIMNNFQRLYEEEELRFNEADNREVLDSLQGTLRFFRMLGDVADIYLNNMVEVLVDAIDPGTGRGDAGATNDSSNPIPPDAPADEPADDGPSRPPEP